MCLCDSVCSDPSQSGGEEAAEGWPVWHHALHSQTDEGKLHDNVALLDLHFNGNILVK